MTEVNPQYGERLPLNFMKNTSSKHVVYKKKFSFCFDIQTNICTQHVVNLYFSCNSMNNLSSYCGLYGWGLLKLPVTHVVYWDHNWIDTSPYTYPCCIRICIMTCISADGCILWQAQVIFYSSPRLPDWPKQRQISQKRALIPTHLVSMA